MLSWSAPMRHSPKRARRYRSPRRSGHRPRSPSGACETRIQLQERLPIRDTAATTSALHSSPWVPGPKAAEPSAWSSPHRPAQDGRTLPRRSRRARPPPASPARGLTGATDAAPACRHATTGRAWVGRTPESRARRPQAPALRRRSPLRKPS